MTAQHRSLRRLAEAASFLLGILVCATLSFTANVCAAAEASADAKLELVFLSASQDDVALLERVRGQIHDLPVALESAHAPEALTDSLDQRVARSQQVARQRSSGAVLSLTRSPAATLVLFIPSQDDRVVLRELSGAARPSSADLEGAALLVRSALQLLLAGEPVGVNAKPYLSEAARSPQAPPRTSAEAPAAAQDARRWALQAGALASQHTQKARALGLFVGLGYEPSPLRGTLRLAYGLPTRLTAAPYTFTWQRHEAVLLLGYDLLGAQLDLVPSFGLGLLAFGRDSSATEAAFGTQTSWNVLATLRPELAFGVDLGVGSPLQVYALVATNIALQKLEVIAESSAGPRLLERTDRWQPEAGVGLKWRAW